MEEKEGQGPSHIPRLPRGIAPCPSNLMNLQHYAALFMSATTEIIFCELEDHLPNVCLFRDKKVTIWGNSLVTQWLDSALTTPVLGMIPGWGTNIPQA